MFGKRPRSIAMRGVVLTAALVSAICLLAAVAVAQEFPSTSDAEETLIRDELKRIIAEDFAQAAEARKALDALDQPESTQAGRQARNRRERGARRIVNGLPTRGYPGVGALLRGN